MVEPHEILIRLELGRNLTCVCSCLPSTPALLLDYSTQMEEFDHASQLDRISDKLRLLESVINVLRWCLVLLPRRERPYLNERSRSLLEALCGLIDLLTPEALETMAKSDVCEYASRPGKSPGARVEDRVSTDSR